MRSFDYVRASNAASAVQAARPDAGAASGPATGAPVQFLAGGTTLLDLMKLDVMRPRALVDLGALRRAGAAEIGVDGNALRFGALVSMTQAADHPLVRRDYPVIAQSLELAASAQLRNMASLGGNVLQRTRCVYFREPRNAACNKREPGSGCAARDGINRQHAVLGASEACIAAYPGDFAQALIALDASVELASAAGTRSLLFANLHTPPGDTPQRETVLAPGELITAFVVPAGAWTRRSLYLKIRDRASYQFALASAAVALELHGGIVRTARIAVGGVATVPWRSREAEAALTGRALDEQSARDAGNAAFAGAKAYGHNAFKLALGPRTLARALLEAGRLPA